MNEPKIVWTCDQCEAPAKGNDGFLTFHTPELSAWEEADRAREARRSAAGVSTLGEILAGPEPAAWRVYHASCAPEVLQVSYQIAVGRADTPGKVLEWTLHIHGKGWLDSTDWDDFVGRRVLNSLDMDA